MEAATGAGGSKIDLGGMGLRVGDKLGNRLGRNRWVHHHDVGGVDKRRDWRDVTEEMEIELLVKRRVDCVRRSGEKQRVAVGICVHDSLGADIGSGSRPVLDDMRLAEPLRQPWTKQTRKNV